MVDGWEEGYNYLLKYIDQHGDALPLWQYVADDGYPLGAWVGTQRLLYAKGAPILDAERKDRLSSLKG